MHHLAKAIALVAIVALTDGAGADEWDDCRGGPDLERIISSCTKLIETPGIDPVRLGHAFSRRACACSYFKSGQDQRSIRDYDEAIRILLLVQDTELQDTRSRQLNNYRAIAYNNRAAAYLRSGKPSQSLLDAEKAAQFAPREPHFYASRGEIKQSLSDQQVRSATTIRQWRLAARAGSSTINAA